MFVSHPDINKRKLHKEVNTKMRQMTATGVITKENDARETSVLGGIITSLALLLSALYKLAFYKRHYDCWGSVI